MRRYYLHNRAESINGYKFAIAFLIASGTILYTVYGYLQKNPMSEYWYLIICTLISGLLISMICLFLYVVLNSTENHKKNLNKIDSKLYMFGLSWLLLIFSSVMAKIIYEFFSKDEIGWIVLIVIVLFFLILVLVPCFLIYYYILFIASILKKNKLKKSITDFLQELIKLKHFFQATIIALIFISFFCLLMIVTNFTPVQGDIAVDMESIHYKSDIQIPVLIQVTGIDNNFSAVLYEGISGNLYQKEDIYYNSSGFELYRTEKYIVGSNGVLVSNYMGNGKYNVFINTTNLNTGYYELIFRCESNFMLKTKYKGKSFYLLDENDM